MMLEQNTITFLIALVAVLFSVYHFFRNPQIKSDKIDALMKQHLDFLTKDFQDRFSSFDKQITNLQDNHIHTLDVKLDETNRKFNDLKNEVVKLTTIIDERIPRK